MKNRNKISLQKKNKYFSSNLKKEDQRLRPEDGFSFFQISSKRI